MGEHESSPSMEVAGAAQVGMVDHRRGLGLALGAIEVVGEDGGEALVGERADRDSPGRDRFRPGRIEPAEQPQDPEAGAEALLGMGSSAEHGDDEPLGVRPERAGPSAGSAQAATPHNADGN